MVISRFQKINTIEKNIFFYLNFKLVYKLIEAIH